MNCSSATVPWVFEAEGPGLWLLLSLHRVLPRTWTHVSRWLPPLSLPKEERDSGGGGFLFMLTELHLLSSSSEMEAEVYSPKCGQRRRGCFLSISAQGGAPCDALSS